MDKEFGFIDLCDLDKKESADHIVGVIGEETVLIPADKINGEKDWNVNDSNDPRYIKNKPVYLKKDSKVYVSGTLIHDYDIEHVSTLYHYNSDSSWMYENNEGVTFEVTFTGSKGSSSFEMVGLPMYELCSTRSVGIKDTSKYSRSDFNFANGRCTLPSEVYYQIGTESDSITYTVRTITDKNILCKSDGTPLDKTFAIDSEKYRYGDALLNAIAGNRVPLIKIPNEDNNDLYDNFVLPWQIQVPKNGNDYVNVFYTKDKFARNLVTLLIEILSTQDFTVTNLEEKFGTLFGEMVLQVHTPAYQSAVECEEPLD